MKRLYFEDVVYEKTDFTIKPFTPGDYEGCQFLHCNFMNADLSHTSFTDCTFKDCNLGTVKLIETTFSDVQFTGCKITGVHFEQCNAYVFTVGFDTCQLNFASFYKVKLKKTSFKNCQLQETDFTEADISESVFDHCDFTKALFENTNLEKADFSTAYNFSINPEVNRIKKARFSTQGLKGLLDRFDIRIED